MGLYDELYTSIDEYGHLPTDFPGTLTAQQTYRALCGQGQYEQEVSKASGLSQLSYRYLHSVLSRSMIGQADNTAVLSKQDILYLYSMVRNIPIHLGHIVADFLGHQGQFTRVGVLFASPYVTRVILGLGFLDPIHGAERAAVPSPLGLDTIRMMGLDTIRMVGLVRKCGPGAYILATVTPETAECGRDTAEGS